MGCDAYASKRGILEIQIRKYDDPNAGIIKHIYINKLKPREKLSVEYIQGEPR